VTVLKIVFSRFCRVPDAERDGLSTCASASECFMARSFERHARSAAHRGVAELWIDRY